MPRTVKSVLFVSVSVLVGVALSQCGKKSESTQIPAVGYDVAVSFTPAAQSKMKTLKQKAVIDGYYYGLPVEATKDKVNDDGQIELGQNLAEIDATDQTVKMTGDGVDPKLPTTSYADAKVLVLVRVYSSTDAGTKNQLSCDTFEGTLTEAHKAPVKITCDVSKKS